MDKNASLEANQCVHLLKQYITIMLDKQNGMQYIPCSALRQSFVSIVLSFAPVQTHVACLFCMIYGAKHPQHFKVSSVNEQGPTFKTSSKSTTWALGLLCNLHPTYFDISTSISHLTPTLVNRHMIPLLEI